MGFPYGADEDAAFMITWMELNKLKGIENFAKILKKINNNFNGSFDDSKIDLNKKINLKNKSFLMKGPALFDYFFHIYKKKKKIEVIIKNYIDPIFIIPLIARIAKKNAYINSSWIEKGFLFEINASNHMLEINKKKIGVKSYKNEILLKVSNKPFKKIIKSEKKTKKIYYRDNQKRLSESLNPNEKYLKIISKVAKKTFVPESKMSRNKGAGGGDDND